MSLQCWQLSKDTRVFYILCHKNVTEVFLPSKFLLHSMNFCLHLIIFKGVTCLEKRELQNELSKMVISSRLYDTFDFSSHLLSGQKCYRGKTPLPLKDTALSSARTVPPLHWFPLYHQVMKFTLIIRNVDIKGKQICVSASYLYNPGILLGKGQSKMLQKVKSSRAISLWNCTHRFRSSWIQLPCTFPDVTVLSNSQDLYFCLA